MRVNVYTFTLSLLKKLFEVLEIMSRNKYRFAFDRSHPYRSWYWIAISSCIGRIKQPHDLEVNFAALKVHRHKPVYGELILCCVIERLVKEVVNRLVFFTQNQRVVSIRSRALETVKQKLYQCADIIAVLFLPRLNADLCTLF